jgi:hypothetical protein
MRKLRNLLYVDLIAKKTGDQDVDQAFSCSGSLAGCAGRLWLLGRAFCLGSERQSS